MKLHECQFGSMVVSCSGDIGFIVGLTYNTDIRFTGNMSQEELLERTIPLVKWASGGETGIHPANIQRFRGKLVKF